MNPAQGWFGELLARRPVITDGAWGTELQAAGLPLGAFPEAWNLSQPERVLAVARAYVAAGSRVILTNTFSANRIRLAETDLVSRVAEINREGVRLSREAAGGRVRVFASIGPTGRLLLDGSVSEEALREAFDEQARALAEAGADALVIETMSDLAEAEIAVRAAKATGLPVVACMAFDSGREKDRTMMGVTPEQAAAALEAAGADVIGANCGQGIERFAALARRLRAASARPIWLKPNAGLPVLVEGRPVYRQTPEAFAEKALELATAGADFIGGCCGTRPDFIRALCQRFA
ncbi:MAG: homocysteine S-methyltransferase family protein [Verrucomicrobiae bacterium]|nr:homocysteine S-methyltransferase family protein [Verrucomicrobiae bacterium]